MSVPEVSSDVTLPEVSANVSVPNLSGSLPEVSENVSVPDVSSSLEGAVPSMDVSGKATRRNGVRAKDVMVYRFAIFCHMPGDRVCFDVGKTKDSAWSIRFIRPLDLPMHSRLIHVQVLIIHVSDVWPGLAVLFIS